MRASQLIALFAFAFGIAACGRMRYAESREAGTSMDASSPTARCGDGVVEDAEQCDDGNLDSADGCGPTCRFDCTVDSDCDDGAPCNGAETCSAGHACRSGAPLADSTPCGAAGATCRAGMCDAVGCGNGMRDAGEQCDDGNVLPGDGCEADCTFTCELASDCADPNPCDGATTCVSNVCLPGAAPPEGTPCGAGVCRARVCVLDGDAGTPPADAGSGGDDAATASTDAGPIRTDAGSVPGSDSGIVIDAGLGVLPGDAGPTSTDAGPPSPMCPDPLTSGAPFECFTRCASDADCLYVSDSCCCSCAEGGTAVPINTAYRTLWSERLGCGARTCMGVACPGIYLCPPGPPACLAGHCVGGGAA